MGTSRRHPSCRRTVGERLEYPCVSLWARLPHCHRCLCGVLCVVEAVGGAAPPGQWVAELEGLPEGCSCCLGLDGWRAGQAKGL